MNPHLDWSLEGNSIEWSIVIGNGTKVRGEKSEKLEKPPKSQFTGTGT